jgi:hypothetical protein
MVLLKIPVVRDIAPRSYSTGSSETSVFTYQSTLCHIPGKGTPRASSQSQTEKRVPLHRVLGRDGENIGIIFGSSTNLKLALRTCYSRLMKH